MKKIIPTEITDSNIAQLLDLLVDAPKKLENLCAHLSGEQLHRQLGVGERSLTEVLAHLLHCEARSSEFIYFALLAKEHIFSSIHPEREYGKLLRYDLLPFHDLLNYFRSRRKILLQVLAPLKTEQWSRSLREEGKQRKESVYWRARSIALHELEHLMEIESKLGKLEIK